MSEVTAHEAARHEATRITGPIVQHGEGPFWDDRAQRLLWVDMVRGAIMSRDAAGELHRIPTPSPIAAVIRRRDAGGFVVALEHGLWIADEEFGSFEPLIELLDDDALRLNEGGCDPLGRFFIGSMAYDEHEGGGRLVRVDADHAVATILTGATISNGLQWSADGRRAFYADTTTGRIDVVDVDENGDWSGRRPFAVIEGPGGPDGMAIDEEDGIWIALWGGGAVRHYDRDGVLRDVIEIPGASQVTACAFGGPERRTLFITTSREAIPEGSQADAGSLYAWEAPVRGAVAARLRGLTHMRVE